MSNLPATRLERFLKDQIEHATGELAKFQAKLAESPVYAFEWSASAFRSAADRKVAMDVLAWAVKEEFHYALNTDLSALTLKLTDDKVAEFAAAAISQLEGIADREVESPSRSTSPQSNEMAREMASAAFRLSKNLKRFL